MTDYGRGPGSEPWHPEDPLYGDQGWGAQQAADGQAAPYGEHPQQQQYPQQQYDAGQDPYQQQYQQQPYDGQQQYQNPQQYQQPQQQYQDPQQQQYQQPQQQYQQQPQGYGDQQVPQHQQHQPQQQYQGGWDAGQQQAMAYGGNPADPYAAPQAAGYAGGQDYYGTPDAYPPPQPPGRRPGEGPQQQQPQQFAPQHPQQPQGPQQPQQPQGAQQPQAPQHQQGPQPPRAQQAQQPPRGRRPGAPPAADPENEWDAPQPKETHPFFTGEDDPADARGDDRHDDEDDDPEDDGRDRRGRTTKKKKKKGGNGRACLVLAVVLVGGVGGAGYFGYTFYQDRFGPPPDFSGAGSGAVEVEIPPDSSGYAIAAILLKKGVIKSQGAFVVAQKKNPKGESVQAGVYTLRKGMSGDNAVKAMLDPNSHNSLIIPPGARNVDVYTLIDKKLKLKAGTTKGVAKAQAKNIGLPKWANDNAEIDDPLEGFLYPASYPVSQDMKPEAVLKKMVGRANAEYGKEDLAGEAKKLGLDSPLQLITVASLVQAEGKYKHDFDKVARVVYNRLKPANQETAGRLEFDSTINYIKEQSTLDVGSVDELRKIDDPYNTYNVRGLPPGPIGNPGSEALHSALNPAPGPWYYFVSVTEDKTLFATTNAEHNKNREKYLNGKN